MKGRFVINGKEIVSINEVPKEIIRQEKEFKKNLLMMALNFGATENDSYSLEYDYGEGFKVIYAKSKELTV